MKIEKDDINKDIYFLDNTVGKYLIYGKIEECDIYTFDY